MPWSERLQHQQYKMHNLNGQNGPRFGYICSISELQEFAFLLCVVVIAPTNVQREYEWNIIGPFTGIRNTLS